MAERTKREGILTEIEDPLAVELGKAWDRCCDELGIPKVTDIKDMSQASSCSKCPVRVKCQRLWWTANKQIYHRLTMTEYRQFSQQFYRLKQERDRLLEKGCER